MNNMLYTILHVVLFLFSEGRDLGTQIMIKI